MTNPIEHRELRLTVPYKDSTLEVTALLDEPGDAQALLVLAHGAGAGMRHAFMEAYTERLAQRGVAVMRYHFPYMEAGKRGPDGKSKLLATVRAALDLGHDLAAGRPLVAGGKSMGGRMTSTALAEHTDPRVHGVVFVGFPLHAAGRPGTERGDHLAEVEAPMLFLQGTRDKLADLELLRPICDGLGERSTLHVVDGADHGFHVLKRSGRTDSEVLDEIAETSVSWMRSFTGP